MITFDVEAMHLEPGSVELDAEIEARCVGRLTVSDSRGAIVSEDEFPCVELGRALRDWRSCSPLPERDFEFDSMSYPEPGLIWIRRDAADPDAWRVGSVLEPTTSSEPTSWIGVRQAIDNFAKRVVALAPEALRPRVFQLVTSPVRE